MKILIGLPTNDSRIDLKVVQSIIDQMGITKGNVVRTCLINQTLIYTARNSIAYAAVDGDYDYLMFIDSDCVLPAGSIERLIKHDKDIVSGMYFKKAPPFYPVIYTMNDQGLFDVIADYPKDSLIEAGGIGMGVCLIKVDVLKKVIDANYSIKFDKKASEWLTEQAKTRGKTRIEILKEIQKQAESGEIDVPAELYKDFYTFVKSVKGPFDPYIYPNGIFVNAEDLAFCIRAKNLGYKIWVDTGIQADHQTQTYITEWYHEETLKRAEKAFLIKEK